MKILCQVPKLYPMVDEEELRVSRKHINNASLPQQGATINHPIGSKKAKIVQYLKDSGALISDTSGDRNTNDNLSASNKSTSDDITTRLDKNCGQTECQMKLKCIALHIQLNQIMEKANLLMREVEEGEERLISVEGNMHNVENMNQLSLHYLPRMKSL